MVKFITFLRPLIWNSCNHNAFSHFITVVWNCAFSVQLCCEPHHLLLDESEVASHLVTSFIYLYLYLFEPSTYLNLVPTWTLYLLVPCTYLYLAPSCTLYLLVLVPTFTMYFYHVPVSTCIYIVLICTYYLLVTFTWMYLVPACTLYILVHCIYLYLVPIFTLNLLVSNLVHTYT